MAPADRARLDQAVKDDDSPYTTFAVSPWSKHLAWAAAQRHLTPNQVTAASFLVALLAAGCFLTGARPGYVAGAVLLQLSFGLDCADGQLARLTGTFSVLGGWLDAMFDRLKEYLVYAGLAIGSARSGDDVWRLAVLALVLQTVRHAVDSAWAVTPASVSAMAEGVRRRATGRRRRGHWLRKVAILPIGERWLLISVLAALTTPRIVFVVLVAAGGLAAAYMLAARVRRSLRPSDTTLAPDAGAALRQMSDLGPLAGALARSRGGGRALGPRWGWLVPPALRVAEYATVILAAAWSGAGIGAATYGYLLAVIWHHYDAGHRSRHRLGAGRWSALAGLGGVEVRTVVVAALAAFGGPAYTVGTVTMAGLLAVVAILRGLDLAKRSRPTPDASAERSGDG